VIRGPGGRKPPRMNLTHTGILGFERFCHPGVVDECRGSGAARTVRGEREKSACALHVAKQHFQRPVESARCGGEFAGRKTRKQVLVVGAHLDSWDLSEETTGQRDGFGECAGLGGSELCAPA